MANATSEDPPAPGTAHQLGELAVLVGLSTVKSPASTPGSLAAYLAGSLAVYPADVREAMLALMSTRVDNR